MSGQVNSSDHTIYVYVTINAEEVMRKYPKNNNKENPQFIEHTFGYMVAGNARGAEYQGTGNLVFKARTDDRVRFVGSTTSSNYDEVAIITHISHLSGNTVINKLAPTDAKTRIVPNIKEGTDKQVFYFYEGEIANTGTENYNVHFTLYTRDDDSNPVLYGYFAWDPQIIVKG